MAKEAFKEIRFSDENVELIDMLNDIIDEYQQQGLTMTLRQLYYQMIGRDLFPSSWIDRAYNAKNGLDPDTKNTEKNYKKLGTILSDARLAGLVDWDAIEDRARQPVIPLEFENLAHRVESALANYRLDRWKGQEHYVELWVEKDALAGVLEPTASKWHVPLMVNRGYSSSSAMYESAQRYRAACGIAETLEFLTEEHTRLTEQGMDLGWSKGEVADRLREQYNHRVKRGDAKRPVLLYLGDHDPSGEDMVRDIADRLKLFGVTGISVEKISLTMAQVRQYNPPPNPAKVTDSRAKAYIEKHGPHSWEVDALPPTVLTRLIESSIRQYVDIAKMDAVIAAENTDKEKLRKLTTAATKKGK